MICSFFLFLKQADGRGLDFHFFCVSAYYVQDIGLGVINSLCQLIFIKLHDMIYQKNEKIHSEKSTTLLMFPQIIHGGADIRTMSV